MLQLLKLMVDICLLRAGPQDLPGSSVLVAMSALAYFGTSLLLFNIDSTFRMSLVVGALDTLLLFGFTVLMLQVRRVPERFRQTFSAFAGTGALLGVCALPLIEIMVRAQAQGNEAPGVALGWFALLLWSLSVFGHIVRHAISVPLSLGIGIGVLFAVVTVAIVKVVFPGMAG